MTKTPPITDLADLMAEEDARRIAEMNTPEALAEEAAMMKRNAAKSLREDIANGVRTPDGQYIDQPETEEQDEDEDEEDDNQ